MALFRGNRKSASSFRWNRGIGLSDRDQGGILDGWIGV